MTGIPFEMITLFGGSILGGVLKLWSQSMQYKAEAHKQQMEFNAVNKEAVEAARNFSPSESNGFHWTRRSIAIMATFAIIVWPKIVPVFWPDMTVSAGYLEFNPGFWFLKDGAEAVKWVVTDGLVITPLDTVVMTSILGLFMGSEIVKRR
jgi:hypothetical protein